MQLTVNRTTFTQLSAIGTLAVDGQHCAFTLEPPKREEKPCCIPMGSYDVKILWSEKHGRLLPHVQDVPGFSEIEIHIGNFPKDTLGCLLVGDYAGPNPDFIGGSKQAFDQLFLQMTDAIERGEAITITYTEQETPA